MRGVPLCGCHDVSRTSEAGHSSWSSILNPIAPFWDGNETWLVLICAGLFAAFPMVYAIFLPAFWLPITLMPFGLSFRGAARRGRDFRNSGRIFTCCGQVFV